MMIGCELISDLDEVLKLNNKEFYSNFSYIMQAALIKDSGLYTDLIDSMYEICDKDESVLSDILTRSVAARDIVLKTFKVSSEKPSPLTFGFFIANALSECIANDQSNEQLLPGELLSLGCVAESYISYQKNWLNKDEYYEIRDMFVPFYLPISISMLDIEKVLEYIDANCPKNKNGYYTLTFVKKIGRTVTDSTITLDDIKKALEEINFDEAW